MITRIPAGAVLLTGDSLTVAREVIEIAQRWRRWNGHAPSVEYARLAAALSATGQADMPDEASEESEYMTTEAAAELLGYSARQVRRLAPKLGGRRIGGRWLLDNQSVREHHEERTLP